MSKNSGNENIEITLANGESFNADLTSLIKLFEDRNILLKKATRKRITVRKEKFLKHNNFLSSLQEITNTLHNTTSADNIYTLPGGFGRHPFGVLALTFSLENSFMDTEYYEKDEQWKLVFSNFMSLPVATADYYDREGILNLVNLMHEPLDSLETMLFLKHGDNQLFLDKMELLNSASVAIEYANNVLSIIDTIPAIEDDTINRIGKETDLSCSKALIIDAGLYRYVEAPCIVGVSANKKYTIKQLNEILAAYDLVLLSGQRKTDLFGLWGAGKYAVSKKYKKFFSTMPRNINQVFVSPLNDDKASRLAFLFSGLDGVLNNNVLTIAQRNELSRTVKQK